MFSTIRIIHFPVFAARWQHWPQICFATFIQRKNHQIADNTITIKLGKKISTNLESLEFQKSFDVCVTKILINEFVIGQSVCPCQNFQSQSNILPQGWGLPQSRALQRCFNWLGSGLTRKHQTMAERLAGTNTQAYHEHS